ncbi:hypothetical protein [Leptolyngbya sp. CCY15150]|uniref:hypothetical protein n=1 Tax=Leptolyngbya sp. CCY15150 TaxID=2767772 RepID=UPI00194FAAB5|nr:hypothetical protein [Leptolyngbya sp. CCY15150]
MQFYEQFQVQPPQWTRAAWQVTCDRTPEHGCLAHLPRDRIWLATGHHLDVRQWSLLLDLQTVNPSLTRLPAIFTEQKWPAIASCRPSPRLLFNRSRKKSVILRSLDSGKSPILEV